MSSTDSVQVPNAQDTVQPSGSGVADGCNAKHSYSIVDQVA